jgi:predicted acyl esterase
MPLPRFLRALLTAVLMAALTLVAAGPAAAAGSATTPLTFFDLPAADGVVLKANLIAPTSSGPHPAIVFISSWGLNDAEYLAQATDLAAAGYVVLSYTSRGFWGSGGTIDTAGPADIADVSSAIDWLVGHTATDPARIGVGGVSYGAGIALIAAGHDARIKAVVAMSAWTDLIDSLYGNQTRHPQAVYLLKYSAELLGTPSDEFETILDDYFANENIDTIKAWGGIRSAQTYLAAINTNHPAVLIANAYGDSLFEPNQLVTFFDGLTGPKRLEFSPGDHAIPEATGLLGLPNHVWDSTRQWFDQYLAGVDNGAGDTPVVLRIRNSDDEVETYPAWTDVTGSTTRYHLTGPLFNTGSLGSTAGSTWSTVVRTGVDTVADGGVVLLSNGLEALTGVPPTAWLPAVNRINGAVWTSPPLAHGAAIRGITGLHFTITPPATTGTIVAYLYDTDATGTGKLIAETPYTWIGATAGHALTVDTVLPATAWDLPAGHALSLVLDTEDPLYLDANGFNQPITIGGDSWVDLPLR